MSKFVGRRGILGLAKETTRGTPVSPTLWLGRNTISFDDVVTEAREEEGLGRIEDTDAKFVTGKMGEGDIEFDLTDKEVGLILTSLLGASPVTTGGPTYTHTYTLSNDNQHKSLSLYYEDPDDVKVFPLTIVDNLSISVDQGGIVKATAGFKSKNGRDWSNQAENFTTRGNKFLHQHVQVKLADNIAGIAAASTISLKSLELNILANTEFDSVLGTVEPEDILNLQFSVEGSMTLNKESTAYKGYMLDGTYKSLEVKFNRAANSSLTLQFPRIDFSEWEQDRDNNSIVSQSINFKGSYDAANALAVISTATLVNTYAGSAF